MTCGVAGFWFRQGGFARPGVVDECPVIWGEAVFRLRIERMDAN
jgi:hypothetical protein